MNSIIVQVNETKDSAFVIMPFSGEFDELKLLINDAANQAGITEFRVDKNPKPGVSIRDGVINGLREAKIVVAICSPETESGLINSNVAYELGYAHSIGKGTLILTTTIESIPFNPQDKIDVIIYDPKKIKRDPDGLVLLIKDKMKIILDRVTNGLTDSGYKDITALLSTSKEDMPPVDRLYFMVLGFAKLVHHHFHELNQDFQEIDLNARTLFENKSKGNQPVLIMKCQDSWHYCEEARSAIQRNIFTNYRNIVKNASDALTLLRDKKKNPAATSIDNSLNSFEEIVTSLDNYKIQIAAVSKHYEPNGILDIYYIKKFEQDAMALAITVGRLINLADSMIKNVIDALEIDTRLGLEK